MVTARRSSAPQVSRDSTPSNDSDVDYTSPLNQSFEKYDGKAHPESTQFTSYPSIGNRRPLIDYVTNEWRQYRPHNSHSRVNEWGDWYVDTVDKTIDFLRSRRFRRFITVWALLVTSAIYLWNVVIGPRFWEDRILTESLSKAHRDTIGGMFGSNARPSFTDLLPIQTLDPSLVPKSKRLPKGPSLDSRRLIFVGDVHGCKEELARLLEKVKFDKRTDHLILLGDMITKGPESLDVIDLAIDMSASCVRGNHEDRILLTYKDMMSSLLPLKGPNELESLNEPDILDEESFSQGDYSDRILAKKLTKKHHKYLTSCPVILRVGAIGKLGEVVAVHAGLVPGVPLEFQDPYSVMTMRSIDLVSHVPTKLPSNGRIGRHKLDSDAETDKQQSLVPWTKLWNKYQKLIPNPKRAYYRGNKNPELHTTVIYGHDSKKGLQIEKWTKGLDTGCVRGGKLTALIISDGASMQLRDVQCKDHKQRKKSLQAEVEDVLREGTATETERPDDDEAEA